MFLKKKTIASFAITGVILYFLSVVPLVLIITTFGSYASEIMKYLSEIMKSSSTPDPNVPLGIWVLSIQTMLLLTILSSIVAFIGGLMNITANVGAIIRQMKLQQWAWLACTVIFGLFLGFFPLVVLIYLIAVPDVPQSLLQNPHQFPPLTQFHPLHQNQSMPYGQYQPQQHQSQQYQPQQQSTSYQNAEDEDE